MQLPDSGFDRVASIYDLWAGMVFGKTIKRAQRTYLSAIPRGSKVLLIGGGTGWLLKDIFEAADPSTVLFLDASPGMIRIATRYSARHLPGNQDQIEFRTGNEMALREDEVFDVVITPFILDLFEPDRLSKLFDRLHLALLPGGTWLFTDFHRPENAFRPVANFMTWLMYRIFRLVAGISGKSLPDFDSHFDRYHYRRREGSFFYRGMIRSVWFVKRR